MLKDGKEKKRRNENEAGRVIAKAVILSHPATTIHWYGGKEKKPKSPRKFEELQRWVVWRGFPYNSLQCHAGSCGDNKEEAEAGSE